MKNDELKPTTPKPFVFVLMPFEPSFNDIFKYGISGAAQDVAAHAERLDDQIFTEGMLDHIFNEISKADVVVADMSGRNPNVFYEVGYAHALGKLVLLLTQDSNDIPFDLKHRQHTIYGGSIEKLRKELAPKLEWAISEAVARKQGVYQRLSQEGYFEVKINECVIFPSSANVTGPVIIAHEKSTQEGNYFPIQVQLRNKMEQVSPPVVDTVLFYHVPSRLRPMGEEEIDVEHPDESIRHFNRGISLTGNWSIPSIPKNASHTYQIWFEKADEELSLQEPMLLRFLFQEMSFEYPFILEL